MQAAAVAKRPWYRIHITQNAAILLAAGAYVSCTRVGMGHRQAPQGDGEVRCGLTDGWQGSGSRGGGCCRGAAHDSC
jgi:hypothetical protein